MTERTDIIQIATEVARKVLFDGYEPHGTTIEQDFELTRAQRGRVCRLVEKYFCDEHSKEWMYVPSKNRFVLIPGDDPEHFERREAHEFLDRMIAGLLARRDVSVLAGQRRGVIELQSAERARSRIAKDAKHYEIMTSKLKFQTPGKAA